MLYIVKLGSITNAQKALRVLKGSGYKAYLSRIEKPKSSEGCGYTVRVYDEEAVSLLKKKGVRIIEVETK